MSDSLNRQASILPYGYSRLAFLNMQARLITLLWQLHDWGALLGEKKQGQATIWIFRKPMMWKIGAWEICLIKTGSNALNGELGLMWSEKLKTKHCWNSAWCNIMNRRGSSLLSAIELFLSPATSDLWEIKGNATLCSWTKNRILNKINST